MYYYYKIKLNIKVILSQSLEFLKYHKTYLNKLKFIINKRIIFFGLIQSVD